MRGLNVAMNYNTIYWDDGASGTYVDEVIESCDFSLRVLLMLS
jgi:hypothetical protein